MFGGIQSSIEPAGPNAESLARLWWLMFWVCTAVYVLVMIALVFAIRKGRKQSDLNPVLNPPVQTENRKRNAVLSAVTVTVVARDDGRCVNSTVRPELVTAVGL